MFFSTFCRVLLSFHVAVNTYTDTNGSSNHNDDDNDDDSSSSTFFFLFGSWSIEWGFTSVLVKSSSRTLILLHNLFVFGQHSSSIYSNWTCFSCSTLLFGCFRLENGIACPVLFCSCCGLLIRIEFADSYLCLVHQVPDSLTNSKLGDSELQLLKGWVPLRVLEVGGVGSFGGLTIINGQPVVISTEIIFEFLEDELSGVLDSFHVDSWRKLMRV